MAISPQIRYAVERALTRAQHQKNLARQEDDANFGHSLQSEAWTDDCESLEEAIEILKGLE